MRGKKMQKQKCNLFIVNGITMKISRSAIEHLCIKIIPPNGEVHIKAPKLMSLDEIQNILETKQGWIIDQQHYIQLSVEKGKWIKSLYIHMESNESSIYKSKTSLK